MQESALQFQKSSSQSIDRLETQLSKLVNIYKNEESLTSPPLANSNISNTINLTHDSCWFGNQNSYTPFLEQPPEDTSHLEKSIEVLQESTLKFQKSSTESIDRLEKQLSKLVSIYRNEKTLSYQF